MRALQYALEVAGLPWPEGEEYLKKSPEAWDMYQQGVDYYKFSKEMEAYFVKEYPDWSMRLDIDWTRTREGPRRVHLQGVIWDEDTLDETDFDIRKNFRGVYTAEIEAQWSGVEGLLKSKDAKEMVDLLVAKAKEPKDYL